MAKKKRSRKQQRSEKARRRREKRSARKKKAAPSRPAARPAAPGVVLAPPDPSRCHPTIYVDAGRRVIPDPYEALGLAPSPPPSPEAIRAAWRDRILARPPEQHPEEAAALREARDRLADPARALERALGELHLPSAEAFGLSDAGVEAPMDSFGRLLGQAVLYAMVEDELMGPELEALYRRR